MYLRGGCIKDGDDDMLPSDANAATKLLTLIRPKIKAMKDLQQVKSLGSCGHQRSTIDLSGMNRTIPYELIKHGVHYWHGRLVLSHQHVSTILGSNTAFVDLLATIIKWRNDSIGDCSQ